MAATARPVKVAHVATIDLSLRFLLLNQLSSLQAAGYSVTGVSSTGPHVPALEARGIRHVAVPMTRSITPLADLAALWRLYRVMRREQFDIVHCHTPKAELLGQLAARLAGVPVVVDTYRGIYDRAGSSPLRRGLLKTMSGFAASCAHLVLCQSRDGMAAMMRAAGRNAARVRLLGNGIDVRTFDRCRVSRSDLEAARRDLGIDPARPVVGFVGRLVREKGLFELLDAMRQVRSRIPGMQLMIVGPTDGDKSDAVSPDEVRRHDAALDCVFTGLRTDLPVLYALMDVLALPSHREGFPRVPMEASAMQVPCVVSDIPGCREVVDHGVNGLLVPVRDASALAEALAAILASQELARAMGEAGRQKAIASFDEERVFETVKDAYVQLLSEARERSRGRWTASGKRVVDAAAAAVALVLLSPVIALVALIIRLTMGAPVLFRQERPGLHGRPFVIWKFRTMRQTGRATADPSTDEERLHPLGRLLRAASLDELPQFVNVLKGDMSLVGPRPLLMQYLERYTTEQARRHDVKPGLTGWAQVNGRNAVSWEERLAMDVWYVDHHSFLLDLQILARTAGMVIRRRGVSAPGKATMSEFLGSEPNKCES